MSFSEILVSQVRKFRTEIKKVLSVDKRRKGVINVDNMTASTDGTVGSRVQEPAGYTYLGAGEGVYTPLCSLGYTTCGI